MTPYQTGRALAAGIVDCIDAMPGKFADETTLELWAGFLSLELERVRTKHRNIREYERALGRFQIAASAFAGDIVASDGSVWRAFISIPQGALENKFRRWTISRTPGYESDVMPGIVSFYAATIADAKAKLGVV